MKSGLRGRRVFNSLTVLIVIGLVHSISSLVGRLSQREPSMTLFAVVRIADGEYSGVSIV